MHSPYLTQLSSKAVSGVGNSTLALSSKKPKSFYALRRNLPCRLYTKLRLPLLLASLPKHRLLYTFTISHCLPPPTAPPTHPSAWPTAGPTRGSPAFHPLRCSYQGLALPTNQPWDSCTACFAWQPFRHLRETHPRPALQHNGTQADRPPAALPTHMPKQEGKVG